MRTAVAQVMRQLILPPKPKDSLSSSVPYSLVLMVDLEHGVVMIVFPAVLVMVWKLAVVVVIVDGFYQQNVILGVRCFHIFEIDFRYGMIY